MVAQAATLDAGWKHVDDDVEDSGRVHQSVDQLTIERAKRGDRDAQAQLLRQLQDSLFRLCLSLLGRCDEHAARDATQETALRLLKLLPTFRGESNVRTWAMGIAVNV